MVHSVENLREDRGMVVLQSLKVSHQSRSYELSKKIWMCELCMFLQIRCMCTTKALFDFYVRKRLV